MILSIHWRKGSLFFPKCDFQAKLYLITRCSRPQLNTSVLVVCWWWSRCFKTTLPHSTVWEIRCVSQLPTRLGLTCTAFFLWRKRSSIVRLVGGSRTPIAIAIRFKARTGHPRPSAKDLTKPWSRKSYDAGGTLAPSCGTQHGIAATALGNCKTSSIEFNRFHTWNSTDLNSRIAQRYCTESGMGLVCLIVE